MRTSVARVCCFHPSPVVDEAIKVLRSIVETYGRPNIPLQPVELTSLEDVDLLSRFSEPCRFEFERSLEV